MSRLKHAPWFSILLLAGLPAIVLFGPIWMGLEVARTLPASRFEQPVLFGLYLGYVFGMGGYWLTNRLVRWDRFVEVAEPGLWYLQTIHWPLNSGDKDT